MEPLIDRAFLRLAEGLVHYRKCGERDTPDTGPPIYCAHASPGSSRALEPLLPRFGRRRFVIAPDLLGNGDSSPPLHESVDVAYYAECAARVLDQLGIGVVDWYGSHTGAEIGLQFAVMFPTRVRRLVFDGIPLFSPELKAELLTHYAPHVEPDAFGTHLTWAWNFVRDQAIFWPYFARQAGSRLGNDMPTPEQIQSIVTEVIKSLGTYHIAYRAAFVLDVAALLPKLTCPVLALATERDPLHAYLDEAADLVPGASKLLLSRSSTLGDKADAIAEFFGA